MNDKNNKSNKLCMPFSREHNHADCQANALEIAQQQCTKKGLKLTKIRQQVLEIIWASHKPTGAYEVLQALQERGHKPAPPTAYRALDFLVSAQLVHRIESLNAFIGCAHSDVAHQCQFYICQKCHHIAEVNNVSVANALSDGAEQLGFVSQQPVIEVHGLCANCQK